MIKVGKERIIKFDKSLREKRFLDSYNINEYEVTPFEFNGVKKNVYKNFNLSIFVDDECNADCKFCVAQLRYKNRNMLYQKDHIKSDKEYFKRLEEVLSYVRPLNPSVSITGGEPTISSRLPKICELLKKYKIRKKTITTNGTGLKDLSIDGVLNTLEDTEFDHINISRTVIDDCKNNNIMRFSDSTNFRNNDLEFVMDKLKRDSKFKKVPHVRMSCVLLKDGVHTVNQIKEYVNFYKEGYGVDNFIFRQLMDYDHKAINPEIMKYYETNKISLDDIWKDMENHKELVPYLNLLGYYYYVEIYKYNECTIASEAANLERQYKEKGNHPDTVYEMVFHTDGKLCGSWIPNEERLM